MMEKKNLERLLRNGWQKEKGYVFVSYSSRDWEKVYPCVLELRARGINVFIDIEFKENSSSSWLHNLEERLIRSLECKGVVSFVSTSYLGSYACLTELIANRTFMQSRLKGKPLPVFYIALDGNLGTPQQISNHIHNKAVMAELRNKTVRIEPAEYTKMENYLLDCHLEYYPDRQAVRSLLDSIQNRFDVATIMNELIFADTKMMPNIQLFEGEAECAELLKRNFINDKNESIELAVLEDLQRRTCEMLGRSVGEAASGDVWKAESVRPLVDQRSGLAGESEPRKPEQRQTQRAEAPAGKGEPKKPEQRQAQRAEVPAGESEPRKPEQPQAQRAEAVAGKGEPRKPEQRQAQRAEAPAGQGGADISDKPEGRCDTLWQDDAAEGAAGGIGEIRRDSGADERPDEPSQKQRSKMAIYILPTALFMATLFYIYIRTATSLGVLRYNHMFDRNSYFTFNGLRFWVKHFVIVGILAGSMHYCCFDNLKGKRTAGAVGIAAGSIYMLISLCISMAQGRLSYYIDNVDNPFLFALLPAAAYAACWFATVKLLKNDKSAKANYLTAALLLLLVLCGNVRSIFGAGVWGVLRLLAIVIPCAVMLLTEFLLRRVQQRLNPKSRRVLFWALYAVVAIQALIFIGNFLKVGAGLFWSPNVY